MNAETDDAAKQDAAAINQRRHFPVLDGLRGIAALIVVLFHSYDGGGYVPNGPLAVDLFFLMSGYVIAHSYEKRLTERLTPAGFLLRRFVRLYPMLFVGALGGIVLAVIHNRISPATAYSSRMLLMSGALSLLVLPNLQPTLNKDAFGFNPPIWSLFFELVANIVYCVVVPCLRIAVLLAIVVAGLVGVVWCGPLGGGTAAHFLPGFPRVVCGFFGGVLLHRLWLQYPSLRCSLGLTPLTLGLLALCAIPRQIGGWLFVPCLIYLAGIVWLAVGTGSMTRSPLMQRLGEISYPVYLVHWLTLYMFTFIGNRLHLVGARYAIVVAVNLSATPFIGYAVFRYYESPARRWLGRIVGLGSKSSRPSQLERRNAAISRSSSD